MHVDNNNIQQAVCFRSLEERRYCGFPEELSLVMAVRRELGSDPGPEHAP